MNQPMNLTVLIYLSKKFQQINLLVSQNFLRFPNTQTINVENMYVQRITIQSYEGISLSKGKQSVKLFGDIEQLMNVISKYVIQVDFLQHYKLISELNGLTKAYHFKGNDHRTVKIIDKKQKSQILKEVKKLRTLNHKNLLCLYEVYEADEYVFLVFEQTTGTTLRDLLSVEVLLAENKVKSIIRQILEALVYIHDRGIIHGSLCPENIIYINQQIKLIDFGQDDGKPGYMAPEQMASKHYKSSDVYSVGIIFYELMTGKNPFYNKSLEQQMINNYYGLIDIDTIDISGSGLEYLQSLLKANYLERFSSQRALTHQYLTLPSLRIKTISTMTPVNGSSTTRSLFDQISPRKSIRTSKIRKAFF
ncbi:hypothetical protein pb186bvf_005267 [Paramecium bursaria]